MSTYASIREQDGQAKLAKKRLISTRQPVQTTRFTLPQDDFIFSQRARLGYLPRWHPVGEGTLFAEHRLKGVRGFALKRPPSHRVDRRHDTLKELQPASSPRKESAAFDSIATQRND